MDPKKHRHSPGKLFAAFWLFLGWLAQVIPLAAFTAPADWKFETLQNASDEWWQTLSVETVPGVVYHLQKSTTLESGDWTTVSTTYGTGTKWVCPIFPGSAPSVAPPAGTPTLPATPLTPFRLAFLVLEKTTTGGTLISWSSLDDHTSRRELLAGVTLDPAWDDFDAGYFNSHGNYLFGISPRLATPVTFTAGSTTLGPLDTAMVAAFTAALPTITANIQNSVANADNYNLQQENPSDKTFYRFSADWSVDSDGDSRYDWQEIILDGNNPFAADSDGDGIADQAAGGAGGGALPTPTDAQGPTPLARIEQQVMSASYHKYDSDGLPSTPSTSLIGTPDNASGAESLKAADTFPAFAQAVEALSFVENLWFPGIHSFMHEHIVEDDPEHIMYHRFRVQYSRFRLKLDAPAPVGGYRIPMRMARVYQYNDYNFNANHETQIITPPEGHPHYDEIMLEVAEGQTEGIPVSVPIPDLGIKQRVTFIPAYITTREPDVFPEINGEVQDPIPGAIDEDGACVKIDESFAVNFGNPDAKYIEMYSGPPLKIHWRKKKLNGNGTIDSNWSLLTFDYQATPYEGVHTSISLNHPGIFQLQALLVLPNGTEIEFPFVRLRNAKSIVNSEDIKNSLLEAGKPDYFGVCFDQYSKTVRNAAIPWLGSTIYSFDNPMVTEPGQLYNPNLIRRSKCNIFVTHVANGVGATTPYYYRRFFIPTAPLAREDWYSNPEKNIDLDAPGWIFKGVSGTPCPGMSVASPNAGGDAKDSGHVGILDYDGSWINAGKFTVNKSVHILDDSDKYKPNNMRLR